MVISPPFIASFYSKLIKIIDQRGPTRGCGPCVSSIVIEGLHSYRLARVV